MRCQWWQHGQLARKKIGRVSSSRSGLQRLNFDFARRPPDSGFGGRSPRDGIRKSPRWESKARERQLRFESKTDLRTSWSEVCSTPISRHTYFGGCGMAEE
jgi:hypothetical protein